MSTQMPLPQGFNPYEMPGADMLYGAGAIPGGPLGMMGWDPSMMAGGFQPPMMDMMSAGTQPFMGAMGGVNPWMNQMMPGGV